VVGPVEPSLPPSRPLGGHVAFLGAGTVSLRTPLPCHTSHPCVPRRYYCINGTRFGCPAGTFQGSTRKSSVSDCAACNAGGYCGVASAAPAPCGNDSVYCPSGSSVPLPVGPGYYSTGFVGARSSRAQCPAGQFCPGDGLAYDCPAGYVLRAPWRTVQVLPWPPVVCALVLLHGTSTPVSGAGVLCAHHPPTGSTAT
jgi:hypothetical protein